MNRGYQVVVAEDCTAGAWADGHAFMVEHMLRLLATITTADDVAHAIVATARRN